ncbi:MAG: hypothetical protein FAF04_03430 [Epsilonproteobacteria bacterium]|nr:hypothetical protein [Campylobacterota bacterium]
MFIASYATYVPTLSATRTTPVNEKNSSTKENAAAPEKTVQKKQNNITNSSALLSRYTLLKQTKENKDTTLFSNLKIHQDAKEAYTQTLQPFSFMKKPKSAQQKPLSLQDIHLPKEARSAKEQILRKEMVNTYIANDNYYRVTAA